MKSRIEEKNKFDVILSIGMIIKNEEKVLRRCLDSLKPLMREIPCELIIADTGSTDSSFEIAKEYTDNVFHFEWIDDFAAARNSTLDKARGVWYMFLDADEYLDKDIHEVIEFFKIPDLYLKYKTLEITVRNYYDKSFKLYSDVQLPRFQRLYNYEDGERVTFEGVVHETIYTRQPLGYFQTILHHTGYCFDSESQDRKKKNRNLVLMREEYRKDPNKLRTLSLLIDGTKYIPEEIKKYIHQSLKLLESYDMRNSAFANVLFMQAIDYYRYIDPYFALELCDKYFEKKENAEKDVAVIAIYYLKAEILSSVAKFREATKEYCKYIAMYKLYKKDELNLSDCSYHFIIGLTNYEYNRGVCGLALCYSNTGEYQQAFTQLKLVNYSDLEYGDFLGFTGTLKKICIESKQYDKLAEYYGLMINNCDESRQEIVLDMIESSYYSNITYEEKKYFASVVSNSGVKGKFVELMSLVISQEKYNIKERICDFICSIKNWKKGYSEVFYLSIKFGIDLSFLADRMDNVLFYKNIEKVAHNHDDFAKYVLDYGIPSTYSESINKFSFIEIIYELAVCRSFELNSKEKMILYSNFCSILSDYVLNIYNTELLNDEDIYVIPGLHRFGYFMYKAKVSLNDGEKISYIRYLKEALRNCEQMKDVVEIFLSDFKKKECE